MENVDKTMDETIEHTMGWQELRETVLMLNLAVAQIEMSMRDGDHSVSTLIDSFTTMSGCIRAIGTASSEIPDQVNEETNCKAIRETIQTNGELVAGKTAAAIIAFQFYDKLTQRLSHVSSSLGELTRIVSSATMIGDHGQWDTLRERIRKTYSMVDEATMYDAIMRGESIEEAVTIAMAAGYGDVEDEEDRASGEVDLF